MDTADFNAEGVNPQIIENYDGNSIALGTSGYELHPKRLPTTCQLPGSNPDYHRRYYLARIWWQVRNCRNHDSNWVLGAEPDIKHCEIRVGFGPDEEIGVGADKFDVGPDVDFAYTMDGGPLGDSSTRPSQATCC